MYGVGLGWLAPLCTMSENGRVGRSGSGQAENCYGPDVIRAAVRRSLTSMLTISIEARGEGGISSAGLAHSVGVCMLEMAIMARGAKKESEAVTQGMPKFVDVRLSQEQKAAFTADAPKPAGWIVDRMQQLVFSGYRFGCSWSGEHQSYTVSMTCRNSESPNQGLCMTSFAGQLMTALRLAIYKHEEVCKGVWVMPGPGDDEDFG